MTLTLTPYIDTYLTSRLKVGTYNSKSVDVVGPRLRTLAEHFGHRPLNRLTRKAIEKWRETLHALAVNSRAAYFSSVKAFTRWLTLERIIPVDPCVDIEPIRRPRSVPRAQTEDAVAALIGACRDERERCIVRLMVGMGLRRMEVAGLCWEHYDERGARMTIVTAKNSDERMLPVPGEVAAALNEMRYWGNTGPIIRSQTDGTSPITPARVGELMTAACRRAGIKRAPYDGVSAHALRHTAASDVLDRCGDLRIVQQMLGHQNLSSTAIYLRRKSAEEMRSAMEGRTYSVASKADDTSDLDPSDIGPPALRAA